MTGVKLITSNPYKFKEFQKLIPNISMENGQDLKEVDGTKEEVAIYKALMAGDNCMVEDTILEVNGKEIVDIRWKIKELKTGQKSVWITTLALNKNNHIILFKGEISGTLDTEKFIKDTFGFDSVFIPNNSNKSLHELKNEKDNFSARKLAIQNFMKNNSYKIISIESIPKWTGKWQND